MRGATGHEGEPHLCRSTSARASRYCDIAVSTLYFKTGAQELRAWGKQSRHAAAVGAIRMHLRQPARDNKLSQFLSYAASAAIAKAAGCTAGCSSLAISS